MPAGTAQSSLDELARRKLEALERRQLRRRLVVTARPSATAAEVAGAALVSFSCNDYLGLSQHPAVVAASVEATRRFGVGAGSARLVNGNHPLYAELEHRLAALKDTEDAVVFGSGYLANVGAIPALVGRQDLIVLDELCHSSLLTGTRVSGSRMLAFATTMRGISRSCCARSAARTGIVSCSRKACSAWKAISRRCPRLPRWRRRMTRGS